MKVRIALLLGVMACSLAVAYMRAYSVEPVKAAWSAKVRADLGVAQTITCNFDSLVYVGFWHQGLDFPAISPVIL